MGEHVENKNIPKFYIMLAIAMVHAYCVIAYRKVKYTIGFIPYLYKSRKWLMREYDRSLEHEQRIEAVVGFINKVGENVKTRSVIDAAMKAQPKPSQYGIGPLNAALEVQPKTSEEITTALKKGIQSEFLESVDSKKSPANPVRDFFPPEFLDGHKDNYNYQEKASKS